MARTKFFVCQLKENTNIGDVFFFFFKSDADLNLIDYLIKNILNIILFIKIIINFDAILQRSLNI